jgi:hypothetical protein
MGKTCARTPAAGMTLDAGALIALDRGNKRMIALLREGLTQGRAFRVPSGALAQAWRGGRTQVTLARFLRVILPIAVVRPMSEWPIRQVGWRRVAETRVDAGSGHSSAEQLKSLREKRWNTIEILALPSVASLSGT